MTKQRVKTTKKNKKRVVHIHLHSIYSTSDALNKPKELCQRAVEIGIDTIVLTDHGNISGVIQMAKYCKEYGLKFIPGCEMYEAQDHTNKKAQDHSSWNKIRHITMLPLNNQGWNDLQQLIVEANTNGFYYSPRISMKYIEDNNLGKNIIATSGCLASQTSQMILAGKEDEAEKEILYRKNLFHQYYLEIQDNGTRDQEIVNQVLLKLSKKHNIPLVYAKDVHYLKPEHAFAHRVIQAISYKTSVHELKYAQPPNTAHFADAEEVYEWADENNIPHEAIENTWKIADQCNVEIELHKNLMPDYPFCPEGHTPSTYLRKLLYDNFIEYVKDCEKKKKSIDVKLYIERIESELKVIEMKGFPSYFLNLWDIILWTTNRKKWLSYEENKKWINEPEMTDDDDDWEVSYPNAKYAHYPEQIVGPGRGSAAGSLMAFLLGITKLDPIEYGLIFERFLNPYRSSMPDIDCDFPGDHHDELLDFVAQRYGRDRTAQIKTFTFFKIKSAIDKICKALEERDPNNPKKIIKYGYAVANEVKALLDITGDQGLMPDGKPCTYKDMMNICIHPEDYERYGEQNLNKFVEASREFRKMMDKYPELNECLPIIEGAIDTSGIHAGGVIISNRPLSLDCPTIAPDEKSKAILPITMYDAIDCEELGLLKMDLLRTATLRQIAMTVDLIEQTTGKRIDTYDIGRDDDDVFDYISTGQTHGLFQINGGGITGYTRQVAPVSQEELIDILALYRPGPLDGLLENGNTIAQQYVINGSQKKLRKYMAEMEPIIKPILEPSRGQMIYQEQLMSLVQIISGYNLGQADTFRRIVGKKKLDDLIKLYDEFMYGHEYVINKWKNLLKEMEDKNLSSILVTSSYDGKEKEMMKQEVEKELKSAYDSQKIHNVIGAVHNGFSEKFGKTMFNQIVAFASYGFNKSHSACYADETYQTAWLKYHYPVEFMTATLTVRGDKKDKTLENLKEAKRMGIKILPPHINKSASGFHPEGDGIRFGLASIAGVGAKAVDAIIDERQKNGDFKNFQDFENRTTSPVNRAVYRTLIQAGCFDEFEPNRHKLLNEYNFNIRKDKEWQGSEEELLKSDPKIRSNHSFRYDERAFTEKRMLEMERELIGVYVSGSPYDGLPFTALSDMDTSTRRDKAYYDVGGRITKIRVIKTKKGDPMAFVEIETQLEPLEFTVFPDVYDEFQQELYKDNIVVVRGYKEKSFYRGEEKDQFICSKILIRDAKKLKKEMGIKADTPIESESKEDKDQKAEKELREKFKPKPKPDLTSELFDEKPKRKRKKRMTTVADYI